MTNALVARSFELLQCQSRGSIRLIELLSAHARIPLRLKRRQLPANLFETDTIRTLVRPGVFGKLNGASGYDLSHDLGQVSDAIVVGGLPNVEGFIEHLVRRGFQSRDECT